MKKTFNISILFFVFLFISCQQTSVESKDGILGIGNVSIIERDSCQYVLYQGSSQGGIIHKHNCKYCLYREDKAKK